MMMGRMFLLLAGIVGWLACAAAQAADSISPQQLAELLDSASAPFVLDVRSSEEFADGRIPGAQLLPHDELAGRIDELGTPREVVVYCRSGRRVGLVRDALEEAGFTVRELEGSFNAWQAAALPVEQAAGE